MKLSALTGLFLVASSLLACAPDDGPGSVLDAEQAAQFVASTQSDVHDSLFRLALLTGIAWDPDTPLDPSADTTTIAASIASHLQSVIPPCADAQITHDANAVVADVAIACRPDGGGPALDGKFGITVNKDAAGISLVYTCTHLLVDRRMVEGIFEVTTNDGKSYTIDADITDINLGPISFQGTARWANTAGTPGVTLSGTGQYHAEDNPASGFSKNGWTCGLAATSGFTTKDAHQSVKACAPDAGTVSSVESFECRKLDTDGHIVSAQVVASTEVGWSATTLAKRLVRSTITTSGADVVTGYTTQHLLTWPCYE
jgi:hypothetical protein